MNNLPITSDAEYRAQLKKIEGLMHAAVGTPDGEELNALVTLVEAYESLHFSLESQNSSGAINSHAQSK